MNIENKTVLVTGSTDGVGRLVARRLADQGARVLIHGRDRTRGEQLLKDIRAANRGSAAFLPADFSSLAEVRRFADIFRQESDRLDILINNAGIGSGGSAGINERPARTAPAVSVSQSFTANSTTSTGPTCFGSSVTSTFFRRRSPRAL